MTKIAVFHNISHDASFGLNKLFVSELRGQVVERQLKFKPCSHELVRVFEFELDDLLYYDESRYMSCEQVADVAFRAFNVGHEIPAWQRTSPSGWPNRQYETAVAYRARRLRALSKGDVLAFRFDANSVRHFACASSGWDEVPEAELRIISDVAKAAALVRERYEFASGERLAITVPLEG